MSFAGLFAAYLVGGIPLGLIVCRLWKGVDPRDHGSGNIGATNISRILGPVGGLLVLLLDVGKGAASVLLASVLSGSDTGGWLPVLAAVAAIAGNNWPVWLGFKGGKGASVSLGAGLAVAPVVAFLTLVVWITLVAFTRIISVATMTAAITTPVWALLTTPAEDRLPIVTFSFCITVMILYRHRANIARLRQGTEPKFSLRKP